MVDWTTYKDGTAGSHLARGAVPVVEKFDIDSVSSASLDNGTVLSWAHTVTTETDRVLYVAVAWWDSNTTTGTPTYAGVAMTPITDIIREVGAGGVRVYELIAPATGENTVSITFDGAVDAAGIGISFKHAHQTSPSGTPKTGIGSGTNPTLQAVPSAANDIVVGVVEWWLGNATPNIGTERAEISELGLDTALELFTATGTPSVTPDWTLSLTGDWGAVAFAVSPASTATTSAGVLVSGAATMSGAANVSVSPAQERTSSGALISGEASIGGTVFLINQSGAVQLKPGGMVKLGKMMG